MKKLFFGKTRKGSMILAVAVLALSTLACNMFNPGGDKTHWVPETPTQYTAEMETIRDVYIMIDEQGNMVDFENDAPFGANAKMKYILHFWDVGTSGGKGEAAIYKAYTPVEIVAIGKPENYSQAEQAAIYARSGFPTTEVKIHDLTFTGGPDGKFMGTNSETGKDIFGHLVWNEKALEMHAVFTEDIKQDYLVTTAEPFYNWP